MMSGPMKALLGALAVAGYQNRDKIAEVLRGLQNRQPQSGDASRPTDKADGGLGGLFGGQGGLGDLLGGLTTGGILSGGLGVTISKIDALVGASGYVLVSRKYFDAVGTLGEVGMNCQCARNGGGECGSTARNGLMQISEPRGQA